MKDSRTYPATMPDAQIDPSELRFEDAMAELESIISNLDGGEIGLEEAMSTHRRGRALVSRCKEVLDAAAEELERLPEEPDAG